MQTSRRRAIRCVRFQRGFEVASRTFAFSYRDLLEGALRHRAMFVVSFSRLCRRILLAGAVSRTQLLPVRRYRPDPNARARPGRHARRGERPTIRGRSQKASRRFIPPDELATMVDNIGMPISGINMSYNNTGVIGPQDGDIQIKLKEGHRPTHEYVERCARSFPRAFPGTTFAFLPADIVSQILNFGAPAPIDIQIRGPNLAANFEYAQPASEQAQARSPASPMRASSSRGLSGLQRRCRPHAGPVHRPDRARRDQQPGGQPRRQRPGVADLLVQPGQRHLLPDRDADAAVSDRHPGARCRPCRSRRRRRPYCRSWAASPTSARTTTNAVVSQYNIQPVVQIYATAQGRDLGARCRRRADSCSTTRHRTCPRAARWCCSGQVKTMNSAFQDCCSGCSAPSCSSTC